MLNKECNYQPKNRVCSIKKIDLEGTEEYFITNEDIILK